MNKKWTGTIVYLSSNIVGEIINSSANDDHWISDRFERQDHLVKITQCKGKVPQAFIGKDLKVGETYTLDGDSLTPKIERLYGRNVVGFYHTKYLLDNGQKIIVPYHNIRPKDVIKKGIASIIKDFGVRDWLAKIVE